MTSQSIALKTSGNVARGGRGSLQHARLRIYEAVKPKDKRAAASAGSLLGELEFQFNPKEMSIARSAKWDRKPNPTAKRAGPAQFTGSEACKLTMELFF